MTPAPAPGVFRSIEPAWNDANLRELAGDVSSPLFFAHIRAAIGSAVQQTNFGREEGHAAGGAASAGMAGVSRCGKGGRG
jgi:hypothetical protein